MKSQPECLGMFPSLKKPQCLSKYKSVFQTDPGIEYLQRAKNWSRVNYFANEKRRL